MFRGRQYCVAPQEKPQTLFALQDPIKICLPQKSQTFFEPLENNANFWWINILYVIAMIDE